MTLYEKFKQEAKQEINALPMDFAFSGKQMTEALKRLGAESRKECDSLGGGALCLKKDPDRIVSTIDALDKKLVKNMQDDFDFAKSAFIYELNNHEYNFTYDETDALEALSVTREMLSNNAQMRKAFVEAVAVCG